MQKKLKGNVVLGIVGVALVLLLGVWYFVKRDSGEIKKDTPVAMEKKEVDTKAEGTMADKTKDEAMMKTEEGFELKGGKMMMVNEKTKTTSSMEKDVTLSDGTVVMTSGKVTKKDGTTIMLTEGQSIWMDGSVTKAGEMMKTEDKVMSEKTGAAMMGGGQYVTYAAPKLAFAKEGKVVLFFRAGWCPVCRALDSDIRSHLSNIPKNVLILDVDYDNAKDLKLKYGVTHQHTFVEVDATGNQIAQWSGSETLAELLTKVQ